VSFLTLGLLIVLAGVKIPEAFEQVTELVVATMLIGLGLWHLVRGSRDQGSGATMSATAMAARPLAIGIVHGLAGSAGIALLAAATISSRSLAAGYLGLVALGTALGMVALTVVMSRPIGWTMRREGPWRQATTVFAALLSMALGLGVLLQAVVAEGAT
jgi:hypothetical protein